MTDIRASIAGGAATIALIAVIFAAVFTSVEPPVSQSTEVLSPVTGGTDPASITGTVEPAESVFEDNSNSTAGDQFILREFEGVIGVFEPEAAEPFLTLDVRVDTLRATDSENLRQGITVYGQTELARLIEDFDS